MHTTRRPSSRHHLDRCTAVAAIALFIVIPKKFDIIDERKAVNLYAKGDVAKVLLDLAKERARADTERDGAATFCAPLGAPLSGRWYQQRRPLARSRW